MAFVSLLTHHTDTPLVLNTTQIVAFGTEQTEAPYIVWVRATDGNRFLVEPIDEKGTPLLQSGQGMPLGVDATLIVEMFRAHLAEAESAAQRVPSAD